MYMYCIHRKYVQYRPICPVEIQIYTIVWNCQSHNPRKYTVLNENFVLDIIYIFQEHNHGVKLHLPASVWGGGGLV
jgi:hypothetical protein